MAYSFKFDMYDVNNYYNTNIKDSVKTADAGIY